MEPAANAEKGSPLLTTDQAARRLGLQRRSLEAWRLRGGGPRYIQFSSRCVRYRPADLDAFIEAHVRASTSDPGSGTGEVVD